MSGGALRRRIYYAVKPLIPRKAQIAVRRSLAARTRLRFKDSWPIDARCASPPPGWTGWPESRRFALVLTHDVEHVRGMERSLRVAALERELGFRSSFNFVPERYPVLPRVRDALSRLGFEIGVHDLAHDGRLYHSRAGFLSRAVEINRYLREWNSVGFRSGSMHHNLEWIKELNVEWDSSTFDTDPFEPQSDGLGRIFPLRVPAAGGGYVELPYTIPQDMTVFVLLREPGIRLWREKLDWIAEQGGMALLNTHPDYMHAGDEKARVDEYPQELYVELLKYLCRTYEGRFWHALPREMARFWKAMTCDEPRGVPSPERQERHA